MSEEATQFQSEKRIEDMTPGEYKAMQDALLALVLQVTTDSKILKESEEFYRLATRFSPHTLLRPFDI
jgi:hypothetical protein